MVVVAEVRPGTYHDSVTLMAVSAALNQLPGVTGAALVMGTSLNRELLAEGGLSTPEVEAAGPNDLVIVVQATDEPTARGALAEAARRLAEIGATPVGQVEERPRSLRSALRRAPEANLTLVSVPGPFAPIEAEEALRAGHHVFLFSDNVPLAEEIRLKRLATELGLLLMGPDCGTALINGVGLGFANVVRRGPIGLIAASGTGLQHVACLIDQLGGGISHGIGTGGRDLSAPVGGLTTLAAIEALGADPATEVLVLISKPPDPAIADRVLAAATAQGKPVVAAFLGAELPSRPGVTCVPTLAEAARHAVALATSRPAETVRLDEAVDEAALARACAGLTPTQRFARGLFSGGTLCEEAIWVLSPVLGPIWSNVPLEPGYRLPDPRRSREHTLLDLGADELTVGRPHPMIDPTLRIERLLEEAADPATACILLDVVLGYGAHPDPAGTLAPALEAARSRAAADGRALPIVVSLVGTERDPQRLSAQRAKLEAAGALVSTSNVIAAQLAGRIVAGARRPTHRGVEGDKS